MPKFCMVEPWVHIVKEWRKGRHTDIAQTVKLGSAELLLLWPLLVETSEYLPSTVLIGNGAGSGDDEGLTSFERRPL